jgi:hypothetical protein
MQHWLGDPDFAGVRDAQALAKLPEEERKDWLQLWEEVAALRHKAAQAASADSEPLLPENAMTGM